MEFTIEELEEMVYEGECLKVNDLSDVPSSYRGLVMHVSDHGNVEVYNKMARKFKSLWSCV